MAAPSPHAPVLPPPSSHGEERLVGAVVAGGVPDRDVAAQLLHATVSVLGERLTQDETHLLRAQLPGELARTLAESSYDGDFDAAELLERVRRRTGLSAGAAREGAEIVLRAIGDAIDGETRARLLHVLPRAIGAHLLPREIGEPPEHVAAPHAPPLHTLAHGRPGSLHPISEAAPPSGQTHSVATNPDPHAETKLSSSRGMTQERWRESLATGRPPEPERPIDEAKDD